ncbi:adenosylmethionine--8-amino-7-oxononanoate transaminase [Planctomycetota bacterium]
MTTWIERDLSRLWHPFTQMKEAQDTPPILIKRAQGLRLYDDQDRWYYDTISSWWCNIHGHNHPHIRAAIEKQLKELDHIQFSGFTHRPAIELAERLVALTPAGLDRVFYSDNGSTAVECALKMSLQYWRNSGRPDKQRFICLDHGYHGDTVGAMSVGGRSVFNQAFAPMLFDTDQMPTPYCYRCPVNQDKDSCNLACIKPLEEKLSQAHAQTAAIILEPLLLAAGGMIVYPPAYLRRVAELAHQYHIHLILDEVATGFGRTGTMFACEQAEVVPDFLCLSKGLTSGTLPFAATLTTEDVYAAFYDDYVKHKTFYHGHTYTANPLGCAAALATLDIFKEDDTLEQARPLMERLSAAQDDFRQLSLVGDVRGLGMVMACELVQDKQTKQSFLAERRLGKQVYERGLKEQLVLRPLGDIIYLFLPLAATAEQLETILERTYGVLAVLKA